MPELRIPRRSSASQLVTWSMCPRKYASAYVLGLAPDFRSSALVLGAAVGSAIGWWFETRLAETEPAIDQALQVFEADFQAESLERTVRWKQSTEESERDRGRALVALYLSERTTLPVVRVEERFEIDVVDPDTREVLPRALAGYFDFVLEDGTVVELKTSARSWRGNDLRRHLQIGAYAAALHSRDGGDPARLQIDVLVKTKAPRLETYPIERSENDNRWWFDAARSIEEAIGARHFPPTPGPLCIECEHARSCAGPPLAAALRDANDRRRPPVTDDRGVIAM